MQSSTFRFDRPDGVSLHVHQWLPDGDVKAAVLIAHGMAEYAARYTHVAEKLTAAGYAVWAPDHRGHGQSVSGSDELGYMADADGWLLVVDDLKALLDRIAKEHPDVPRFLFGHSMGSFLAQTLLFRHAGAVDGAILQASDSGAFPIYGLLRAVVAVERRLRGPRATSIIPKIQSVLFNAGFQKRTKFDWITLDEAVVDAYIDDPLCGFDVTAKFWDDLGYGMKLNASAHNVEKIPKNLPLYVVHGADDPLSDKGKGIQRLLKQYQRAGLTSVEHKVYPNLRHEIHNEATQDQVLADHVAWLDRQVDAFKSRRSAA